MGFGFGFGKGEIFGIGGGLNQFLNTFSGSGADSELTLGFNHAQDQAKYYGFSPAQTMKFDPSQDPRFADIDPTTGRPYTDKMPPMSIGMPPNFDPFRAQVGGGGYQTPLSPRFGSMGGGNPTEQLMARLQMPRMRGY